MRSRSPLAVVVALLAAWVITFAPRGARAQTTTTTTGPSVTGIVGVVQRLEPNGSSADNANANPHPSGVLVNVINFEDCEADLIYEFDLGISSLNSGYNLNVWAGTQDCSDLTNRQAATAVCWPVSGLRSVTANPFPVSVRMRDIVSQANVTTHTVTYSPADDPTLCQAQTTTGAQTISLYFFFADSAGNAVGTDTSYAVTLDTRAQDVVGNISAGVGDGLLIVNVPSTTDTDTQGWNVYCDPPPGEDAGQETVAVDAASNNGVCSNPVAIDSGGTSGVSSTDAETDADDAATDSSTVVTPPVQDDAGGFACGIPLNDAGIPSPGGCSVSSILIPGGGSGETETVDEAGIEVFTEAATVTLDDGGVADEGNGNMVLLPSRNLCGFGGASSTQIVVKGLTNQHFYNLSVAATDAVGNVGPLSNVVCGEPVPVNDFLKNYYNDGGRAGGGFCSTDGVGTPAGTGGLGALMVASIAATIRRRRRK